MLEHQFLDSIVVSISACHVEGPGSIPGRGVPFCLSYSTNSHQNAGWIKNLVILAKKQDKINAKVLAPRGIEPVTFALLARRSNQLS